MGKWVKMGDWSFDPAAWPDVPGMMKNLTGLGMKVMVSAWPFTAVNSTSIDEVQSKGYSVTVQNSSSPSWWDDNVSMCTFPYRTREHAMPSQPRAVSGESRRLNPYFLPVARAWCLRPCSEKLRPELRRGVPTLRCYPTRRPVVRLVSACRWLLSVWYQNLLARCKVGQR